MLILSWQSDEKKSKTLAGSGFHEIPDMRPNRNHPVPSCKGIRVELALQGPGKSSKTGEKRAGPEEKWPADLGQPADGDKEITIMELLR
jgi:hypothetical protein